MANAPILSIIHDSRKLVPTRDKVTPGGINNNEDNLRRFYGIWSCYFNRLGVHLIPTAMPGFVMKSTYQTILPKSTERFASQLRIGMDFLDDEIRCLFITGFEKHVFPFKCHETCIEGGFLIFCFDILFCLLS